MATVSVWGNCNGYNITFKYNQTTGWWDTTVPMSAYGDYVVELWAEDDAGNVGYYATVLITVDLSGLQARIKVLDMSAQALSDGFLSKKKQVFIGTVCRPEYLSDCKIDEFDKHIFLD